MYETSNKWKEIWYKDTISILNIYIDDTLVNPDYIFELKKGGDVFEEQFELGTTPCQYIEMQIHKSQIQKEPSKVRIEYGILTNDSDFEMIPLGIYNVDDYTDNDDNTLTIKALDNMINFEKDNGYYDGSELINKKGTATLLEIAQDICNQKGVELRFNFFFK